MLRIAAAAAIALMSFALFGQVALAGEWNPGHFNTPGGDIPAKEVAASECVFNGLDEADESYLGAGDGESIAFGGDDGDWAQTPAGGIVQSGGQITATGAQAGDPGLLVPTGIQGVACNPTGPGVPEP